MSSLRNSLTLGAKVRMYVHDCTKMLAVLHKPKTLLLSPAILEEKAKKKRKMQVDLITKVKRIFSNSSLLLTTKFMYC